MLQRPARGLLDVSAGSRPGRVVELRPGASNVSILDARGDSSGAQTVTAQLSVAYAFGTRPDGSITWPDGFAAFPTVVAEWGVDGGASRAVLDLVNGAALTVVASFLRLTATYPTTIPNRDPLEYGSADPSNPLHLLRVSAVLGLFGRSTQGGSSGATLTVPAPVLAPDESVDLQIPAYARGVNFFAPANFRASWLANPTAVPTAAVAYTTGEGTSSVRQWSSAGASFGIPNGTGILRLTNLDDQPSAITVLWQLTL